MAKKRKHTNWLGFVLLTAGSLIMVTLTLVRNHLTHETEEGERIRLERKADSNIIDGYKKAGLLFLQKGEIRGAVLINALVYTYYGTATTASLFFATYYTGYLGFSASQYGVAGGVYTFGTLVSMNTDERFRRKRQSISSAIKMAFG